MKNKTVMLLYLLSCVIFAFIINSLIFEKWSITYQLPIVVSIRTPIVIKERVKEATAEVTILEPVPLTTVTPTTTPVKQAVVPFKKYLTPEGNKVRETLLPIIEREYDADNALALDNILKKEAGYRPDAMNGEAGGFPQALPATKMGCPIEVSTEAITCQYAWIKAYVARRYGTPLEAWKFHEINNWY